MVKWLTTWALHNRLIVIMLAAALFGWGVLSVQRNPIDAIPDLSENQVIVFTEWMGRSPQILEDQVTYPLVSNLQGIPKVKNIRGASMFGMSFVYIIFEDDVDIYWARTRVAERLSFAQRLLPAGVMPTLGPDGTGVGHIYWYTLHAPGMDLAEQRALQDWYIKFALQTTPGVAEVASFGGFEKQYQIVVDPLKLQFYGLSLMQVMEAVRANNNDVGGRKFEMSDMAYVIRGLGYIKDKKDLEELSVATVDGMPVRLRDIATLQMGGEQRLGIFDENGNGEVVGGIVVMRYNENADEVIQAVKTKIKEVEKGLPEGVRFKTAYDRSVLIEEAITSVKNTLIEEMIAVSVVVLLFLFHWRSALIILIQLPISVAIGFILLEAFGISSNIMSLTGIALAIGVVVDDGIVMVENAYRHISEKLHLSPGAKLGAGQRLQLIERSSRQVGPGVFYSTIVVIASFLPVFLLTGMEGKLFHPLAWTKTFILLVDAVIAITLTPVLISLLLKGKLRPEEKNPLNHLLERIYTPILTWCLHWRKTTLVLMLAALATGFVLLSRLGSEFMPPLDEGSLLFMPVTLPDVSNSEIKRILQVQDKLISAVPEVSYVLGKAGRASTATDNAPISMIETIILLKPRNEWRAGVDKDSIINELNGLMQFPGVTNGWTQPIINRINMLSTGIRTDVGIKVYGQRPDSINLLAQSLKKALEGVPGVSDLYVEPITGGKYIDIALKREELGRYGLTVDDVNTVIESALGGMTLTTTIEGRRRFGVNLRYAQEYRNSLQALRRLQVQTMDYGPIPLEAVADVQLNEGPPMINSENAMLRGAVLFNVRGRDLGSTVQEAQQRIQQSVDKLPKGYFLDWSGQWENQIRANRTLQFIVPIVIAIIFMVLYMTYNSVKEAMLTMITVPTALVGGVVMVYAYGVNLSVAVAVGFIALFGMAIETAMLMTIYLNEAMSKLVELKGNSRDTITHADLRQYVIEGAAKRLRPKLMTVSVSLFGLIPILWATGTGSDVMRPITIPLIGGTISSTIYVLLVTPVVFEMVKEWELRRKGRIEIVDAE
ncbi:MAG: efflux RND transporter permease subunit [Saprospiraceae bacterium]|jgi:Cu(I)/Ag(I) efflux system membrane protein CusA/SilA|nr:efflux RND transporter permease subunit [Saprospiraceae bacterium]